MLGSRASANSAVNAKPLLSLLKPRVSIKAKERSEASQQWEQQWEKAADNDMEQWDEPGSGNSDSGWNTSRSTWYATGRKWNANSGTWGAGDKDQGSKMDWEGDSQQVMVSLST